MIFISLRSATPADRLSTYHNCAQIVLETSIAPIIHSYDSWAGSVFPFAVHVYLDSESVLSSF